MKFPAPTEVDPRPSGRKVDPEAVEAYIRWFRSISRDRELLMEWHLWLNDDPVLYCAVHDRLTYYEKTRLKDVVRG